MSHYKDPYQPTSIMECQQGFERCSHVVTFFFSSDNQFAIFIFQVVGGIAICVQEAAEQSQSHFEAMIWCDLAGVVIEISWRIQKKLMIMAFYFTWNMAGWCRELISETYMFGIQIRNVTVFKPFATTFRHVKGVSYWVSSLVVQLINLSYSARLSSDRSTSSEIGVHLDDFFNKLFNHIAPRIIYFLVTILLSPEHP